MYHGLPTSAYRHHPLVLGVFGQPDGSSARRFFDEAPGARVLTRDSHMEGRALGPVDGRGTPFLHWGAAVHSADRHATWQDLSEGSCAAGLVREGRGWVLFTDAVGINSVYVREWEGSLFFATRMAPLIALPGRMNVDWMAWSSIFVMGSPLGQTTPFLEINRLEGATGLAFEIDSEPRPVSYSPTWLGQVEDELEPEVLGEAVREALPPRSALPQSPAITLSGGWDSRLIAGLAADAYMGRQRAWTSATDDGLDLDVSFAPAVARMLRMRHTTILQPDSGWPDLAAETRARAQFETWLHPWLSPLFRRIRDEELNVLDGLGGDVLIKGLFVNERLLKFSPERRVERLFRRLGYQPERRFVGRFREGPAHGVVDLCRQSFLRIASRYSGHMNQLALTVLYARTARAIAIAPTCLLAPEVKPWFPFLAPKVLSISLGIQPDSKTDGTLYKKVLHRCVPLVADLPSTNDAVAKPSFRRRRIQTGVEATTWMIDSILASSTIVELFLPNAVASLRTRKPTWEPPDSQVERLLMACSLFAQWEHLHRDRLVSAAPPW